MLFVSNQEKTLASKGKYFIHGAFAIKLVRHLIEFYELRTKCVLPWCELLIWLSTRALKHLAWVR